MPRPHIVPRRPQPRQVEEDPLLPALAALPDQDFGGEPLLREPYLGPGGRPGDGELLTSLADIVASDKIAQWRNGCSKLICTSSKRAKLRPLLR